MKRLLPSLLLALTLPLAAQLSLDSKNREGKPILINSDTMSVDIEKGVATFRGNVIVNDPDVIITCKTMILYQEPKEEQAKKSSKEKEKKEKGNDPLGGEGKKLERIECIEDVVITRKNSGDKNQWGTCGKAVYFHKRGAITMTVEPILYQDESKITGTRLTFFTNSKQIEGSDIRISARNLGEEKEDPKSPQNTKSKKKKTDADIIDDFYKKNDSGSADNSSSGRVKQKLTQKEADALLGLDKAPEKDK